MKKSFVPLIAGSAGLIALLATWAPSASAQAQTPAAKAAESVASAVGRRCVITLDPQDPAKKREGQVNSDSYKVLENKVEGELLEITPGWVVLKDGNYENWVPRDKSLFMRVTR